MRDENLDFFGKEKMNLGSGNKERDGDNAHFSESMFILGEGVEDSQLVFEKILVLIS